MRVIAKVKLQRGNVAFFDPKTRIHLTIDNSVAAINDMMDIKNIKRAVRNGTLILLAGSLVKPKVEKVPEVKSVPVVPEVDKTPVVPAIPKEPEIPVIPPTTVEPQISTVENKEEAVAETEQTVVDGEEETVDEVEDPEEHSSNGKKNRRKNRKDIDKE